MADGYKVQISGNIGNGLFVLLGDSVAEVEKQSEDLKESYDRIAENLMTVKQISMAKEVFSGKPAFQDKPQNTNSAAANPTSSARPAAQAAPQPPNGPNCNHGAMVWKDFVSKAGKDIKGHFCPSNDRDDQCPPKYKR